MDIDIYSRVYVKCIDDRYGHLLFDLSDGLCLEPFTYDAMKEVWVIRSARKLGLFLVHISSYHLPKSNAFRFHPVVIKMLESFKNLNINLI